MGLHHRGGLRPESKTSSRGPRRRGAVTLRRVSLRAGSLCVLASVAGCATRPEAPPELAAKPSASASAAPAVETCDARIALARSRAPAWAPTAYDSARAEILGRARGEPVVFVREPTPAAARPGDALRRLRGRRQELRGAVLREGYVFADSPAEARVLTTELTLGALFDEPTVYLQRGATVHELSRRTARGATSYVDADGRAAELLFGDRVALTRDELATPLHIDVAALADVEGLDRVRPSTRGEDELVAEIEVGATRAVALLTRRGAEVELTCVDEVHREELMAAKAATAGHRAALARLRAAVDVAVREELPFDRPIGEKTAEKDGQRRPVWEDAYRRGVDWFVAEGGTYPVFDARGEPHPPEVCVEFIVDSFERATGTWYRRRGDGERARVRGLLDFGALGLTNRRGVLAFEAWATKETELFDVRRFAGAERVPFGQYAAFIRGIQALGELAAGDVVAIQGRKRDGLVHQHGILVLRTDPVTGFPFDLADQMRRARRRTWDGIMAEAPLRSLLYRARPSARVLIE